MKEIFQHHDLVLKKLAGKIDDFYLAGGTALARYYFHHRESYDLDFFTQKFSSKRVQEIAKIISSETKAQLKLVRVAKNKRHAQQSVYDLIITKEIALKIDFVEDVLPLKKSLSNIDGINVLSLTDIYLRKIFAVAGTSMGQDEIGRQTFVGGRQEAKDLFDLYYLSKTHERLSVFSKQYCDSWMQEGLIVWFSRFSRRDMRIGLTEINASQKDDFAEMERHFRTEINELIKRIS